MVSSLAYWAANLRRISGGTGPRSGGCNALVIFSNCSRVKVLTQPAGLAPFFSGQAPFRVTTGAFMGTLLAGGGVGLASAAAGGAGAGWPAGGAAGGVELGCWA